MAEKDIVERLLETNNSHSRQYLYALNSEAADLIARLRAAPDGWRVVPEEPTPAMVEAACLAMYSDMYRKAGDKYREPLFRDMTEALHAALAASPSPAGEAKS